MATTESVLVGASLKAAWDYYFEPSGWPAWVDGFARVESAEGYPQMDGALVWRSVPAGRGKVAEKVLAHEPRTLHRVEYSDPESRGELTTRFAVEGGGTRVTLELDYRLATGGPFSWLTDRIFVRGQMRASLRRSLARFRLEVEDLVDQ
jgi:hypothetical protein